jgi:hypothetical protein
LLAGWPGWRGAGRERCAFPGAARPWGRDDERSAWAAVSSPLTPRARPAARGAHAPGRARMVRGGRHRQAGAGIPGGGRRRGRAATRPGGAAAGQAGLAPGIWDTGACLRWPAHGWRPARRAGLAGVQGACLDGRVKVRVDRRWRPVPATPGTAAVTSALSKEAARDDCTHGTGRPRPGPPTGWVPRRRCAC